MVAPLPHCLQPVQKTEFAPVAFPQNQHQYYLDLIFFSPFPLTVYFVFSILIFKPLSSTPFSFIHLCCLLKLPTRGWPWQKGFHLFVSRHPPCLLRVFQGSSTPLPAIFLHPISPSHRRSFSRTPTLYLTHMHPPGYLTLPSTCPMWLNHSKLLLHFFHHSTCLPFTHVTYSKMLIHIFITGLICSAHTTHTP